MFDDLNIDQPGLNYRVETTCSSPSYVSSTITTVSPPFHIHEMPITGMLRKTGTMLGYKGPVKLIEGLMAKFESSMGSLNCAGKSCKKLVKRSIDSGESISVDKDIDYPW